MSLVHNERTKLTATWLNTLAAALVATGVFAPAAALLYGLSQPAIGAALMMALAAGCLIFGLALHVAGRMMLRSLRE